MIRDRLDAHLEDRDLEAVWFARPNSFAWLTGGDNVVSRSAPIGVAAAGYDGDGITVVTDNIEAPRLADEELDEDVTIETFDWYEGALAEAVAEWSPTPAAADFDVPGFESIDASPLRQPLTPAQIESYRLLGRETAEGIESVCRQLESDDTEREVAAALEVAFGARGIDTPVVLIGGSERAQKYRHFTPKDVPLGSYALVTIMTQREGLNAACTRTIAFDDAPDWLADRHEAAMQVETDALAATQSVGRDGGTAGDVFETVQEAYEAVGFPGEWQHHHQGGAIGYAGREWFGTPDAKNPVRLPMAYAWNPTVQGAKSEDTVLVTDDEVDVLSRTGTWPTRTITAREHDLSLERHEILYL